MNKLNNDIEWQELLKMKEGAHLKDWLEEGVRCLILRGNSSLCAYLGIPIDHPLAGHDYDSIPLQCHWGLTYSGEGDGEFRPKGYYWYGWDYSHHKDYSFYFDLPSLSNFDHSNDIKWKLKDVENDMVNTLHEFKLLVKLSESIAKKLIK